MKGYLKKSLAIAMVAMMSAAAMAGCGDSGTSSSGSAPSNSTPASDSSNTQSGVTTLKVLTPESDNAYLKLADREKYPVWQALEQRMTDHGVAVEMEIVPRDQYKVTIQTRMASANDLPDFANISELDATTRLNLANQGILLPINELLEKGETISYGSVLFCAPKHFHLRNPAHERSVSFPVIYQRCHYEGARSGYHELHDEERADAGLLR